MDGFTLPLRLPLRQGRGVGGLHGVRCGKKVGEGLCPDLQGGMAQTASRSAWAPGLKRAIRESLLLMDTNRDSTSKG